MNRRRYTSVVTLGLLALWAAGGHGCGAKRQGRDGAVAEASAGDTPPPGDGAVTSSCDPGLQNCPAGNKCDFSCSGAALVIGCRTDNGEGAELGMVCGGSRLCKKGSGCFAAATANAACRKYCATDSDCSAGLCQTATITISCAGVATVATMKICF